MTLKTILFDYGGVLVEPLDVEAVAQNRTRLATSLGFTHWQTMWNHFYVGDVWQAAKTGQITDEEMWDTLLTPFGLETKVKQTAFTKQLFEGEGVQPQMRYLLEDLQGRYQLGILSNASDILESVLDKHGLTHYFDVIINSHRIGVAKPDTAAYQIALQRLNARPDEVFFIDNQERNTKVAEELGITSHVFTSVLNLIDELARLEII